MARFKMKTVLSRDALADAVSSRNPMAVAHAIASDLWEGKINPDQFSLRALWEGFVGRCEDTLDICLSGRSQPFVGNRLQLVEEVRSTAFAFATGNMLAARVMDRYQETPSVLDQLVTPENSNQRIANMVGFQAFSGIQDVPEGKEYPSGTMAEKVVTGQEPTKRGWIMDVTEEAVQHDSTGQLLRWAGDMGQSLRNDRELRGFRFIEDATNYKSFYPAPTPGVTGVQTDLYRSSAGTAWYNRTINIATTNALVDWTDVDAAKQIFRNMRDEANQPMAIYPDTLLVPESLLATALRITNATEIRVVSNTNNTTIGPDIVALLNGVQPKVLSSPFLSSSTDWFLGLFKSQFVERILIPPQVAQINPNQRRDFVASFVARHKSNVVALDDKFVVKSTA